MADVARILIMESAEMASEAQAELNIQTRLSARRELQIAELQKENAKLRAEHNRERETWLMHTENLNRRIDELEKANDYWRGQSKAETDASYPRPVQSHVAAVAAHPVITWQTMAGTLTLRIE